MKKKGLYIIISGLLLICGYFVIDNINNKSEYYLKYTMLEDSIIEEKIDYEKSLTDIRNKYNNNDVVGTLEIPGADYIVPIMQGEDNSYYLNHTPDGKENFMGSIYLDYRNNIDTDRKLLIFGHNSSNIEMPFKVLENFYDKDYYDNHKYVEITTGKEKKIYEIFSVHVETEDFTYMNLKFLNDNEWLNHLKKLKDRSMYDTGIDLEKDDEILILQTCSTHRDYNNYQKKYLLIVSRRVK